MKIRSKEIQAIVRDQVQSFELEQLKRDVVRSYDRLSFIRTLIHGAGLLALAAFLYVLFWNLAGDFPFLLASGSKSGGDIQDWLALAPIGASLVIFWSAHRRSMEVAEIENRIILDEIEAHQSSSLG